MVLGIFSIFYVALYIRFIFMAGVCEDLVPLYLGPGFCCKVSCQFFKYEPFHKPIEGCLGYESFQTLEPSDSHFDPKFTLHFSWTLLRMKIGNASIRIVQFHGQNHFTA